MTIINYNVKHAEWKKSFPLFEKYISQTVNQTIKTIFHTKSSKFSISFLLTSNQHIKELNNKYRKKNSPTNVLSFPMMVNHEGFDLLGDIVLSSETLLKESSEKKITKYDYLCKMTIHGMLHLLGYDHETEKEYNLMSKLENQIFKSYKNSND